MKANWKIALMCFATVAFFACKPKTLRTTKVVTEVTVETVETAAKTPNSYPKSVLRTTPLQIGMPFPLHSWHKLFARKTVLISV